MSRKMLINAAEPEEIRVAIVEGSILEEYYVERISVGSCLGNIYKGRVTNVEPSIGAAFVEFGGPRHGFLHVSDVADGSVFERGQSAGADEPDRDDDRDSESDVDDGGERERGSNIEEVGDEPPIPEGDDRDAESRDLDDDRDDDAPPSSESAHAERAPRTEHDEPHEEHEHDEEHGAHAGHERSEHGEHRDEPQERERAPDERRDRPQRFDRRDRRGRNDRGDRGDRGDRNDGANGDMSGQRERKNRDRNISDLLKKGQEVIVQVTKDGIGTKGPTLTTYLSIPGRYLVLMPGIDKKGVSRKIDDGRERDRLKKVLDQLDVRPELGFIVRTAGVGQSRGALQKDYRYLTRLWDKVVKNYKKGATPSLLYGESDLVIRSIRDIYTLDMGDVIIDEQEVARRARDFLAMVMPKAASRIKLYDGERPLFTAFGVEDEIGRLFQHRVELPSGGSLVIEQTEALVAIDVNSGRFREEGDLEETAFKTNMEAADAVARQLRLRDLGGVIVVDFIDMRAERRRRAIERAFRDALKADRARVKVARISPFGVIELTRQRVRPSLRQSIFQRCVTCRGAGYIATPETFELNLVRNLRLHLARKSAGLDVFLNHENAEYMMNEKRQAVLALEQTFSKPIRVKIEPELRPDEFRIVPLDRLDR